MSTKSRPEELIRRALDGELLPLGDYRVRADNGGIKTRYPKTAQSLNELNPGDEVRKFVDQETGATVTVPIHELEDD